MRPSLAFALIAAFSVGAQPAVARAEPAVTNGLVHGVNAFGCTSTVDGTPLSGLLWVPPNFQVQGPRLPLFVYLHAAAGDSTHMLLAADGVIPLELDQRGWIGLSLDGRPWSVPSCDYEFSTAYIDSPTPAVGPGERDVLDAIDWCLRFLPVDPERVFLTGHSLGAGGAGAIALKNPDRFAGLAMMAPVSDLSEFYARNVSRECLTPIPGGPPGVSAVTDTLYKLASPRFLLENSADLAVFHGHGQLDELAFNLSGSTQYEHGWHIATDGSWSGCHPGNLCYGHTPTHAELSALHPEAYEWAYLFTSVHHALDARWYQGAVADSNSVGTPVANDPSRLIGMFDFFASRRRAVSPSLVVFKAYERLHQRAYWASIEVTRPWQDAPGAIRALRNTRLNRIDIELARVRRVTIDLELARVSVAHAGALSLRLSRLVEPAFDPALDDAAESLAPTIVLRGAFAPASRYTVLQDGQPLLPSAWHTTSDAMEIGPVPLSAATTIQVFPRRLGGASGINGPIHGD